MNHICCASFLEHQHVPSVQLYLSQSTVARLVAATVISYLNYCNSVFTGLPADQITWLQQVYGSWWKNKMRSCNTTSHGTSLATHKNLLPVQDHDSCLPPFWRVFTSLSFFISPNLQTVSPSLIFRWKAAQHSKAKPKIFWRTFFQFLGSFCL